MSLNMAEQSSTSSDYWGSWFSTAKQQALELATKAQELAENAGKVAQEQATNIVKHAQELRENYDLEVATSILMSTVGGPINPNGNPTPTAIDMKLTKADLSQLDMIYVTENLISMAFPRDKTKAVSNVALSAVPMGESEGGPEEGNDINVVAAYLRKKHQGRFMIWNISEESYDYTKFVDQVLEYRFPGHPAPPLGLLFKICTSVESWLDADDKNVAVIHCLTGKGRTATLLACILTWLGEFDSPMQALQYVANRRGTVVDYLTIPSQRRYIQYFSNLLDGVRPNSEPLVLRRVIINSIPIFGEFSSENGLLKGCCPYIQLFKNGKLIATAAAYSENTKISEEDLGSKTSSTNKLQLRWVNDSDGTASFRIDCPVQGDILLRCRHASVSGNRMSMFRAAFHTGYITGGVLRLTKVQLDGTSCDSRYSEDFFIDLIFAPLNSSGNDNSRNNAEILPEAAEADKYENSIHKDARFWESVASRKVKSKKRKSRKFLSSQQDQFSIADDSKILLDSDNLTEISFLEKDDKNSNIASSISSSYQQDMDLIKQLAELESADSGNGGINDSTVSPSLSTPTVMNDEGATVLSNSSSGISKSTIPSTPKPIQSVKVELQALEDLEKELGLSDLHLFSNEKKASDAKNMQSVSPKPTPTKLIDDDDNLDELEKYLQSLSTNGSSN